MQAEIFFDNTCLRSLKSDWHRLWHATAARSPFTAWEWAWHWYRAYADAATPVVVVVRDGARVSGIAPLARTRRGRLLFVGGLETWPEYATFLAAEKDLAAVTAAALQRLQQERGKHWWLLELPHVAERSVFADTLRALNRLVATEWPAGRTWQTDVPDNWSAYLQSISKNRRSTIRKLDKRNRSIQVRSVLDGVPFDRAWHELVRLHQTRWQAVGEPGCFASRRFHAFHCALAAEWTASGRADILIAWDGDRAVAADYVFLQDEVVYGYQAGFDLGYRDRGTGLFLFVETLRRACECGWRHIDMLSGDQEYKVRFATRSTPICDFWLCGPGFLGGVAYLTRATLRSARRAVRRRLEAVWSTG